MQTNVDVELEQILAKLADGPQPGAILEVRSASRGIDFRSATGSFERGADRPLRPTDGYRIASTSKLFTGTLCMQLAESGELDLETPVGRLIDVDGMPLADGHMPDEVTLQRLLNHTSGLWDFAMSPEWGSHVRAHGDSFFDPRDTLRWAFTHGHAIGPPGAQYAYSDTGFVMLGLILEQVTGESWATLCRRRIFEPLQMNEIWLEGYEAPRCELSHTYLDELDGLEIHGSVDWAAGGHVSTTGDLCTYIEALNAGRLFHRPETLVAMLEGAAIPEGGTYGAGISTRELAGQRVIGHGGFWGSFLVHAPDLDLTIAGTVNRVGVNSADHVAEIVRMFS